MMLRKKLFCTPLPPMIEPSVRTYVTRVSMLERASDKNGRTVSRRDEKRCPSIAGPGFSPLHAHAARRLGVTDPAAAAARDTTASRVEWQSVAT